jgi:hypothetical protein
LAGPTNAGKITLLKTIADRLELDCITGTTVSKSNGISAELKGRSFRRH